QETLHVMRYHLARKWMAATWALVVLPLAVPGCAADHPGDAGSGPVHGTPMKNFGVIWARKLTRSGMPRSPSGWQWLHDQGVKSVVTFRHEHDVDYGQYGITNIVKLPFTAHELPTERQVQEFLDFVQDPAHQPVHIHCKAGMDRTGMMAALIRYAVDRW